MAVVIVIKYPSYSSSLDFFYRGDVIIMIGIPHRTGIFKYWSNKADVSS